MASRVLTSLDAKFCKLGLAANLSTVAAKLSMDVWFKGVMSISSPSSPVLKAKLALPSAIAFLAPFSEKNNDKIDTFAGQFLTAKSKQNSGLFLAVKANSILFQQNQNKQFVYQMGSVKMQKKLFQGPR